MTPEEAQRIQDMTRHMITRCVGRYLIDLPDAFVLNSEHFAKLEGADVLAKPMSKEAFDRHLASVKQQYQASHMSRVPGEPPALRAVYDIEGGLIFDLAKMVRAERQLEALSWRDGFLLQTLLQGYDSLSFEEHRRNSVQENDVPEKLTQLKNIHGRLRGRADQTIPDGQGVCFVNGVLLGPPSESEWLSLNYELKGVGDGYVHFDLLSDIGPGESTLTERMAAVKEELAQSSGHVVRSGARVINGLAAEEYLATKQTDRKSQHNSALLEVNGKLGNALAPLIRMRLSSGSGIPLPSTMTLDEKFSRPPITKPAFSEAETAALWDKITATLRPRPGAF